MTSNKPKPEPLHLHLHLHDHDSKPTPELHFHLHLEGSEQDPDSPSPGKPACPKGVLLRIRSIDQPAANAEWPVRPNGSGSALGFICALGRAIDPETALPAEEVWAKVFDHEPSDAELVPVPADAVCGRIDGSGNWVFSHNAVPNCSGSGATSCEIPNVPHNVAATEDNWLVVWSRRKGSNWCEDQKPFLGMTATMTFCEQNPSGYLPPGGLAGHSELLSPLAASYRLSFAAPPAGCTERARLAGALGGPYWLDFDVVQADARRPVWRTLCGQWKLEIAQLGPATLAVITRAPGHGLVPDEPLVWSGSFSPLSPANVLTLALPNSLQGWLPDISVTLQ